MEEPRRATERRAMVDPRCADQLTDTEDDKRAKLLRDNEAPTCAHPNTDKVAPRRA
eukprot:NODE_19775_length_828_cov_2.600571.p4 GENE.NODE_19775_length_828_cov_2.600571~~NODE_19775_length_828_cov_2.600571.p4  ORF type:complete len:56 (-),score=3.53 NODE_19775_length_828_cov_2.600571:116-283(-)